MVKHGQNLTALGHFNNNKEIHINVQKLFKNGESNDRVHGKIAE